jgi:hypothetical protein
VISRARQLLGRPPPHGRRCSPAATTAPRAARAAITRAPYPLTTGPEVKLFTPLPTLTVEFSPHRSSSPLPPCLSHRRPPPPVLLRPHLLHLEHRLSPRDLNVHFNASLEPFSGLPPPTLPRPSTPSWRATLGEPPAAFCLKSEPPSPGATLKPFPCRPTTVGRPNFTGEPPTSRGDFSSPVFPRWAETAVRAGPCQAGTPF